MRRSILWMLFLLSTVSHCAFAGESRDGHISETISLFAGNSPAIDFFIPSRDLIGARYQVQVPIGQNHRWVVSPGMSFGYGHWKDEQTSPPPTFTSQTSASYWDAMLDLLYRHGCCDDEDFYCGPGLFYTSQTLTEKLSGAQDTKYDPYKTFGLQLTVGGGIPIGSRFEMTGSVMERAGTTSFHPKLAGGQEQKFSSWHWVRPDRKNGLLNIKALLSM